MSKENRVEFYYLPLFYVKRSNGAIPFIHSKGDSFV
jgi:hypothetical protein